MIADRVLPLSGIHNFRDYGGYAVEDGGRLRQGLLWRSAHHEQATDADLGAVDALGLDAMDRRYLAMIADIYRGGPVGVETLAAGLSEPRDTIEDVIEPYLLQIGLIARTARGRCLNASAWKHLGLNPPAGVQDGLFDSGGGAAK